jgi:hypothetical protein
MINLPVDEAYAFDYLSILQIKLVNSPSASKEDTYTECKRYLKNQLHNFEKIVSSKEYYDLLISNQSTFDLIDQLRSGKKVTAKEIDDANMDRYYKKQALQNAFFNSSMKEEKIIL